MPEAHISERSCQAAFSWSSPAEVTQMFIPGALNPHECVLSRFSRVQLFAIPWIVDTRLLCPWSSPGKNTGVSCHVLLQGIFLTQCVSSIAGRFFTTESPGKPLENDAFIENNE